MGSALSTLEDVLRIETMSSLVGLVGDARAISPHKGKSSKGPRKSRNSMCVMPSRHLHLRRKLLAYMDANNSGSNHSIPSDHDHDRRESHAHLSPSAQLTVADTRWSSIRKAEGTPPSNYGSAHCVCRRLRFHPMATTTPCLNLCIEPCQTSTWSPTRCRASPR